MIAQSTGDALHVQDSFFVLHGPLCITKSNIQNYHQDFFRSETQKWKREGESVCEKEGKYYIFPTEPCKWEGEGQNTRKNVKQAKRNNTYIGLNVFVKASIKYN